MFILTIASHTLEGLPGPPQGSILIMIISELDKCTPGLFFCKREVTYELGTLPYGLASGAKGGVTDSSTSNVASSFTSGVGSTYVSSVLGFCVLGGEAQWGALALLLGRA